MKTIKLKPKSYDELSRALIEATTDNLFLEDENKKLKSIIKEAKEYVEKENVERFGNPTIEFALNIRKEKLLEILDKENKQ